LAHNIPTNAAASRLSKKAFFQNGVTELAVLSSGIEARRPQHGESWRKTAKNSSRCWFRMAVICG
jgi:hypothetical protein